MNALCPCHNMLFHTEWMKTRTGSKDTGDETSFVETPLIPNKDGGTLSKSEAIEAIRHTARRCGACLTSKRHGPADALDTNDNETKTRAETKHNFCGHALRISGAQLLARMGIELYLIQLIGRWGSMAVVRYVQNAPLAIQNILARAICERTEKRHCSTRQTTESTDLLAPPMESEDNRITFAELANAVNELRTQVTENMISAG